MTRLKNVNLDSLIALVNELKTKLNLLQTLALYAPLGNPGFQIKTNFDIENSLAFPYVNGGTLKNVAVSQTWDTGTAATFPQGRFGAALLSMTASATRLVTWFTNSTSGYASEAAAIAAITLPDTDVTALGYATVQAHAGNSFTAGTDALTGGSGGNVAAATTYYNLLNPNSLRLTTLTSYVIPGSAEDFYK